MNCRANNYLLSLREECVDSSLCSKFLWRVGRGNSVMVIQLPQLIKKIVSFLKGIRSVQFSRSSCPTVTHGLQHARVPCPLQNPGACSNSCPSCRWCLPTIPSSVVPFSSCLQSSPSSGSSPMSQFFASGGQSIGVSALPSVLPMNTQDWSPLGWTGWTSLQSKGLTSVVSNSVWSCGL